MSELGPAFIKPGLEANQPRVEGDKQAARRLAAVMDTLAQTKKFGGSFLGGEFIGEEEKTETGSIKIEGLRPDSHSHQVVVTVRPENGSPVLQLVRTSELTGGGNGVSYAVRRLETTVAADGSTVGQATEYPLITDAGQLPAGEGRTAFRLSSEEVRKTTELAQEGYRIKEVPIVTRTPGQFSDEAYAADVSAIVAGLEAGIAPIAPPAPQAEVIAMPHISPSLERAA